MCRERVHSVGFERGNREQRARSGTEARFTGTSQQDRVSFRQKSKPGEWWNDDNKHARSGQESLKVMESRCS